jgi:heme O synthase-like polyprenyltransferase
LSVVDHNAIELSPRISEAGVADYIALLKPRVMSLVIFTALVGLVLAPGHFHPVLAFTSILCIAVGAGASGALNMWYESDIDAKMTRTANRPIPRGRVTRPEALTFGMTLAFFSVMTLGILVNWFAGGLLAFTSILCIAVGAGASGALNMWYESDIDALMSRTANRPIPRGRITRPEALAFGMTLAFFSVMTLGILVNWFAGALLAFPIFFYVVIYTMALKRWTAQNIVIGGAAAEPTRVVGML